MRRRRAVNLNRVKERSRTGLIAAIIVLLLPPLYVGSYLALVSPSHRAQLVGPLFSAKLQSDNYRAYPRQLEVLFWPLEQVDRQLRPDAWAIHVWMRG